MPKYHQGKYKLQKPDKYVGDKDNIIYRSSWEKKMFIWCEKNTSVIKWGSEIAAIPYYSSVDSKVRRYYPDIWLIIKNKDGVEEKIIVEIKPDKETKPPLKPKRITQKSKAKYINESITYTRNQDKWKAAKEFANKHGVKFVVMNEYHLGISKRKNGST